MDARLLYMLYIIIGAVALCAVAAIRAQLRRRALKAREAERELTGEAGGPYRPDTVTPAMDPSQDDASRARNGRPPRSLDQMYADAHGMWVCPRCETLNDNAAGACQACGAHR